MIVNYKSFFSNYIGFFIFKGFRIIIVLRYIIVMEKVILDLFLIYLRGIK